MTVQTQAQSEDKAIRTSCTPKRLRTVALRAYRQHKTRAADGARITELLPLVPKIANRVISYLKPPLSFDDLVAAGMVGLVKAAKDYDPSKEANFKTYAYIRIKGAILDELKGWSFVPPELAKQISKVVGAARDIKEQTGTEPSDQQLAYRLGISTEKLYRILENARARDFLSLDSTEQDSPGLAQLLPCKEQSGPEKTIERAELIEHLAQAIRQLPEKKRRTILLYYHQDLTMKQIAELLDVTESRVSQLHAAALFTLSLKLRQWKDGRG